MLKLSRDYNNEKREEAKDSAGSQCGDAEKKRRKHRETKKEQPARWEDSRGGRCPGDQ